MVKSMHFFAAVAAAGLLSLAVSPIPSTSAADLSAPGSVRSERPAKIVAVKRKHRVARHRAVRRPGPGWIWVRRAHKDHYKYVYREFGSYFARGRPSCWC